MDFLIKQGRRKDLFWSLDLRRFLVRGGISTEAYRVRSPFGALVRSNAPQLSLIMHPGLLSCVHSSGSLGVDKL